MPFYVERRARRAVFQEADADTDQCIRERIAIRITGGCLVVEALRNLLGKKAQGKEEQGEYDKLCCLSHRK